MKNCSNVYIHTVQNMSNICTVSEFVDKSVQRQKRSGIILYTMIDNEIYIGMGVHSHSHDFTDFGGSVKKNEDVIKAAIREFTEETLFIFNDISISNILNCMCVYDNYNIIIFVPISMNIEDINNRFYKSCACRKINKLENCCIAWIKIEEFVECLYKSDIVYSRVSNLLKPVIGALVDQL